MKVSLNQIRYYQKQYHWSDDPTPEGVDALVQKIGAQLAAVEEVIPVGDKYNDVVVVKVVSCDDHPDADRLHICRVDDANTVQNVERGEDGLVQIVCGAPNVHAGMLAAWLPPGSTVPSTLGKDPFVLDARDIRGQKSNGMLASPKELGIGDNHEGIMELEENEQTRPGVPFVDAVDLKDDVVIDMENKMFTHRPDLFGMIGVAREIAGIQRQAFKSPDWYQMDPEFPHVEAEPLPLEVRNEIPDLVPRFTAIVLRDVELKPSPVWLQVNLVRLGLRPINNIVDYTNYYMLLTGQPIHAYDYDKVRELSGGERAVLVIRHPKEGEKITLLNGKTIDLVPATMMVAAGEHLAGVGGAMGGADTEVDEKTKNIIIEIANWDMYAMRRTSMHHGIFSDAVTRFTKGQSPLQNLAVLAEIVGAVRKDANGKVASEVVDINHVPQEAQERGNIHAPVTVSTKFINDRLGWDLSADEMATLLTNVECKVAVNGDELTVTAPFWRTDIEIPEDVVEEVGRLYGYDHLPMDLPPRDLTPAPRNNLMQLTSRVRELLSQAGVNEVLTYSFVHGNMLDKVGQDKEQAFRLSNALSPDLQYFRLSLTPSLLDKVHMNIKAGHDEFALFEMNKVHSKALVDADGLPEEFMRCALVYSADDKTAASNHAGAPYYQAHKYLSHLLAQFGLMDALTWKPLGEVDLAAYPLADQMVKPFEPVRSAAVMLGDKLVGVVGEYRAKVIRELKLPSFTAGFELFASALSESQGVEYVQLPRFPKVEQDICLRVPSNTTYQDVFNFVWNHLKENRPDSTYHSLGPVDIYQREGDSEHKQITLRLTIASFERTLETEEVAKLLDQVAAAAKDQLGAERI